MEFGGFGKNSGPSTPPRGQTPFGHFTRPPSPSPSPSPSLSTTPRSSDIPSGNKNYLVPYRAQSPPMVLQNNLYVGGEHPREFQQSLDIPSGNKSYLVPYRAQSPPAVFQNNLYGGGEHPGVIAQQRPFPSSVWGNKSKPSTYNSTTTPPGQDGVSSVYTRGATFQPGQVFQTRQEDVPLPRRTRSPVLPSAGGASPENTFFPSAGHRRPLIDYRDLDAPEAMPSPPLSSEGSFSSRNASRPFVGTQRPSSPMLANQSKSSYNSPSLVQEGMPSVLTTRETYPSGRTLHSKPGDIPPTKRTRSPTPPSTGGDFSENSVFDSDGLKRAPDSHSHRHSSVSGQTNNVEVATDKPVHFQAVKRTKLPILSSSDQVFQENLDSAQETERELDAKAKRLARFKDELSQPIQSHPATRTQKVPAKRQHQPTLEKKKFSEDPTMDVTGDFDGDNVLLDYDGMGSSNSIVGLCPDMCPESERAERERKGDLDQYERVDGDRNLTSEFLAVKKYTRTAEREADLIRPMPILQKTMDYLLNLLDQPYDDRWLRLYNFLWDRMRAIRMDLRMQHIFNIQAITMLEQMIRLHIIAMHELCEYTKGEGFAEGFDAHLNIEQMNKTSVELFQLYDDHRKKGKHVPSEREFRGYYALLKLDKHPGYKVEPAELSLDLAKMTPEMRQTHQVLFARDVARACRTGNFIAFFRLARKASYLQACLMHAHFSKLRTQALASLHSGLQVNQGIPISHVAKWLGMEEEDIGILLEHHGFSVKEFEEPYMVKEYTFLNVDNDFPVKRSKLVDRKRSMMIVSDVSFPSLSELHATEEVTEFQLKKDPDPIPTPLQTFSPVNTMQPHYEETHDLGVILSPKGSMQKPMYKISTNLLTLDVKTTEHEIQLAPANPLVLDFSNSSPEHNQSRVESAQKPLYNPDFRNSFGKTMKHDYKETAPITLETAEEERAPDSPLDSIVHSPISEPMFTEDLEDEEPTGIMEEDETDEVTTSYYDKEVAEAKIKLILRIWKRRTAKKKELRVNKQLAANAALSLLSLGPPIWQYEVQSGNYGMFNIDHVMSERHEIQERSWSVLNPSDAVAAKLAEKNPDSKCLCWKMVLCSQNEAATSAAGSWLHSKLIPAENDSDDLLVSSPGLAIWKSWFPSQSGVDTCCLSVIKSTTFDDMDKSVTGASAVLFLLSEHIPIEIQKNRLHDIVMLLPSGSRLPLLILSCSGNDESDPSAIANDLGLNEIDLSKVIKFDISFLKDNEMKKLDGFFSNEHLGEGLEWLASESPPQIVISETKTRELVQSHLNYTLGALDETNIHKIGPNHCISAFNEALDRSMMEIAAAAHANPTRWPCPEIGLLDESNDVYKIAAWYLPSIGWSSPSRIEKLICVLKDSKLPILEDDISWLSKGLNIGGDDIKNYKVRLENCLINYLTVSNQMMGAALAQKEANAMVQKCTRLELQNATYYIMPKWVHIFRRIFSWRLTNLTSREVSSTYVLVGKDFSAPGNFESGFGAFLPPYVVDPSLDELVEVGCHELGSNDMEYDDFRPVLLPMVSSDADVQSSKDNLVLMENEERSSQNNILTNYDNSTTEANEDEGQMMYTTNTTTEADKLSELLEKCNIMQNLIDKKLSIYF